jgi:hypothetical protein
LIDTTKQFSIVASFTKYVYPANSGNVTPAEASGDILFIDPCLAPSELTSRQTPESSGNFLGNPVNIQLTEFIVQPARCSVTYSCTAVTRVDGDASAIDCDRIGDISDGQLTITATSDDYQSMNITPGSYEIEITGTSGSDEP